MQIYITLKHICKIYFNNQYKYMTEHVINFWKKYLFLRCINKRLDLSASIISMLLLSKVTLIRSNIKQVKHAIFKLYYEFIIIWQNIYKIDAQIFFK